MRPDVTQVRNVDRTQAVQQKDKKQWISTEEYNSLKQWRRDGLDNNDFIKITNFDKFKRWHFNALENKEFRSLIIKKKISVDDFLQFNQYKCQAVSRLFAQDSITSTNFLKIDINQLRALAKAQKNKPWN